MSTPSISLPGSARDQGSPSDPPSGHPSNLPCELAPQPMDTGVINPVLVEVWRGGLLESCHRGAYAVMTAHGDVLASAGDLERTIFPRSSCKTMQAIPLVESGAADAFRLNARELALACASHEGGRTHWDGVRNWLARLQFSPEALECGAQMPRDKAEQARVNQGEVIVSTLHNNCSGKHAGFLTTARHLALDPRGYTRPDHPLQRRVFDTMAELCGMAPEDMGVGVDGCSAATPAMPLRAFGLGVARCADPSVLEPARAQALVRLFEAQAREPSMVAGEGTLDTAVIDATGGQVILKRGAEGVYAAYVRSRGLGVVLKIDDGAARAADAAISELLLRLGVLGDGFRGLSAFRTPVMRNWLGLETGQLRPNPDAFALLPPG